MKIKEREKKKNTNHLLLWFSFAIYICFFVIELQTEWTKGTQIDSGGEIRIEVWESILFSMFFFILYFSWNIFDLHFPLISIHVSDLFFFSFHWITRLTSSLLMWIHIPFIHTWYHTNSPFAVEQILCYRLHVPMQPHRP